MAEKNEDETTSLIKVPFYKERAFLFGGTFGLICATSLLCYFKYKK